MNISTKKLAVLLLFFLSNCSLVFGNTNELWKSPINNQNIHQYIDRNIIFNYEIFREIFLKNEQEIPINKFLAFYFDSRDVNVVKYTEIVDYPAAHIAHAPFYGISGENFGAYWIGYLEFKEMTVIDVNVRYDDAQQIIIDDVIQLSNENMKKNIQITLPEGRHKVEICYLSKSLFPSFLTTFTIERKLYDVNDIKDQLSSIKNSVVWYCGVHSSENFNYSIDLKLRESKDPVILFLASEDAVIWKTNDFGKSNIKAIVIASNSLGSFVSNVPPNIKVINYDNVPIQHNLSINSTNLKNSLEYITGKKLSGFSGSMLSKSLNVPDTEIDMNNYYNNKIVNFNNLEKINNINNISIVNCNEKYHDDFERKICIKSILHYADDKLNLCYKELKNLLDPTYEKFWERKRDLRAGELQSLISSQRSWINARNALCGIEKKIQQKKDWVDYVAESTILSNCILEETENRITILEEKKLDIKKPLQQSSD